MVGLVRKVPDRSHHIFGVDNDNENDDSSDDDGNNIIKII